MSRRKAFNTVAETQTVLQLELALIFFQKRAELIRRAQQPEPLLVI
jgi:hypothetical protein